MRKQRLNTFFDHIRIFRGLMVRKTFWVVLFTDIVLIAVSHVLAYAVRFDFELFSQSNRIIGLFPFFVAVKIPVFYIFGLYRGMWRYTSITDLLNIFKAVCVSSGFIIMSVLYLNRFEGFSRSVFFMDGVFCFLLVCAHRGVIRYVLEDGEMFKWLPYRIKTNRQIRRLLLVGAGAAAEKVIREVRDNHGVPYEVVGLVDDDYRKQGLKIHGIPVLGKTVDLKESALRVSAEEILITIASATGEQMKRLVDICRETALPFKVLPSMGEIIKGRLSVSAIREVDYRDLLGRPVVSLDQEKIGSLITGRTIMVTGAGGSIGSELCKQLVRYAPGKLILLDAAEENLYKLQMELHHTIGFHNYIAVLAKIQNESLLDALFEEHAPSMVLHAAAYKHVPLIELNPWEAVSNNIQATKCLLDVVARHNIERFVLVSTDKAVRPTNVMGASKRLTEMLMLSHSKRGRGTSFMAVRFGNVLGSSGSVVPLFRQQIAQGGPVTVTHPDVTRYFMSIDEAAQLILQAATMGSGGEIFILKMGQPVKIANLARDLVKLMGYEPDVDIKIIYQGLRPGEKLYEELITEGEGIVPTAHKKIMVLQSNGQANRVGEDVLSELFDCSMRYDARGIKDALRRIIPEYQPDKHADAVIKITTNIDSSQLVV
ncbi:polysaccharide biosynthesis protein [Desulfopila aestuarii]|uniref:NDP-sugar epimerase, includes UDP-GlcNAc-inverting 4,6-dehydratase FlaA1 and capsular polysaccharide biosynthesis protein EpsC n=1 Tax=Desulfopila aestuarii DSM 18488 TaxID=1121416 RepID=A0A1M7XVF1_9BACT|nr:nucleoside-diphosphate sugar epimerase/dehydratase [Desulfopila aestuarii]SHO42569.1 NDP-sugar epimerase, includes UDP-GlcNAc-inverting 4,6-dehydratase FlaA1 and capsular polysaccharide biosynthesis protein EpsC [Desulfopila aestuarii DSM 18488]